MFFMALRNSSKVAGDSAVRISSAKTSAGVAVVLGAVRSTGISSASSSARSIVALPVATSARHWVRISAGSLSKVTSPSGFMSSHIASGVCGLRWSSAIVSAVVCLRSLFVQRVCNSGVRSVHSTPVSIASHVSAGVSVRAAAGAATAFGGGGVSFFSVFFTVGTAGSCFLVLALRASPFSAALPLAWSSTRTPLPSPVCFGTSTLFALGF